MGIIEKKTFIRTVSIIFIIIFLLVFAINLSGSNFIVLAGIVGFQFLIAIVIFAFYSQKAYLNESYPLINKKTIKFSLLISTLFGVFYIIATRFIPGLSVGVTLIPQSISTSMSWFVVNISAPILESIFAFGVMLVGLKKTKFGKEHKIASIFIIGAFMSILHLGAYVAGIVDLNFFSAVGVFSGNIGAFLSAFLFFTLSGFLVIWKKTQCVIVAVIPHFIINFTNFTKAITIT